MMNILALLALAAGVLLGLGRGLDLAFGTDAATGLCTVGSVWWRYAALAAAVLLGILAGRTAPAGPKTLRARRPLAGGLALLGAAFMMVAAMIRLLWGLGSIAALVRAVLEALCAVWLCVLGRAWLRREAWHAPAGSLYLATAGSAVFYWCVLARFMENSSSWQRAAETAQVWQYLAALLFLTALARALYLPEAANGRALCASGLCCFALCLCWQLPQTVQQFAALAAQGTVLVQAGLWFGLALCFVGAMGGFCAALCLRRKS